MWSEDEWPGSVSGRPWREGFFDFGSGLTKKVSGFGFGYCAYCGVKAKPLIILCISISCKETQLMLRKNWNIITTYSSLQPTAMPPIQKNSVVPKKQASKVCRYFRCRHCKVSSVQVPPNQRWRPQVSRVSVPPSFAKPVKVPAASFNVVTPKRAKLNPEKMEDLVVVKCNWRLHKAWASESKLLPFWLIDLIASM